LEAESSGLFAQAHLSSLQCCSSADLFK